jgi:peptide/nickel transport system ATP-binding protein
MIVVTELSKAFTRGWFLQTRTPAVRGVSLKIKAGENLAIVGPSGCGKSTLARLLLCLLRPDSGRIYFDGMMINTLKAAKLRILRRKMQLISQHPETALNPCYRIFSSLVEPLRLHRVCTRGEERQRIDDLLAKVGLNPEILRRFPHEVSGGQIQRVAIARALLTSPRFLVMDEPTAMLDVSVQAQVMGSLYRIQRENNIAILLITHDLNLAKAVSDRIMVMHAGRIVEEGLTHDMVDSPKKEFTRRFFREFSMNGEQRG